MFTKICLKNPNLATFGLREMPICHQQWHEGLLKFLFSLAEPATMGLLYKQGNIGRSWIFMPFCE